MMTEFLLFTLFPNSLISLMKQSARWQRWVPVIQRHTTFWRGFFLPPPFTYPLLCPHLDTQTGSEKGLIQKKKKNAWSCSALCPPPGDRMWENCQTSHRSSTEKYMYTTPHLLLMASPPFMFMRWEASLWPWQWPRGSTGVCKKLPVPSDWALFQIKPQCAHSSTCISTFMLCWRGEKKAAFPEFEGPALLWDCWPWLLDKGKKYIFKGLTCCD